jgi:hypothetical protein
MQTKTGQVHAALRECEGWYAAEGEEIRLLSERTEELWFQVDDLVRALQEAESRENAPAAARLVHALLCCALAIEAEVHYLRTRNRLRRTTKSSAAKTGRNP